MIYDANVIDIMGKRKDGGLEFYIISTGEMDDTPDTQTLLLDKIQHYMEYIHSNQFREEFPDIIKSNIWIVLKFDEEPPRIIMELCKKIVLWVEDNGIKFMTCVKS